MDDEAVNPDDLSQVIGTVYDCAIDPHYWPRALESIAQLIEAANGLILMLDTVHKEARLHVDWNLGPDAIRVYNEKYHKGNPMPEAIARFDVDEPYNVPALMDVDEFLESDLHGVRSTARLAGQYGRLDPEDLITAGVVGVRQIARGGMGGPARAQDSGPSLAARAPGRVDR